MTTRTPLSAIALVTPVQLMIGGIIFLPAIYVFWRGLLPYGRAISSGKPLD